MFDKKIFALYYEGIIIKQHSEIKLTKFRNLDMLFTRLHEEFLGDGRDNMGDIISRENVEIYDNLQLLGVAFSGK